MISPVENQANDMGPTVTQELIPDSQDIRTQDSGAQFEPSDQDSISPAEHWDFRSSGLYKISILSDDFGTRVVGFKTHSTDIPTQSDEEISGDENKHFRYLVNYKFHSYEDRISDEYPEDDGFVYTREHRETISKPWL